MNSALRGNLAAEQALQAARDANKIAEKQNDIASEQAGSSENENEITMQVYDFCFEHGQVSRFSPEVASNNRFVKPGLLTSYSYRRGQI